MPWARRIVLCFALIVVAFGAPAQETSPDVFAPALIAPREPMEFDAAPDTFAAPVPYAPAADGASGFPIQAGEQRLMLEARLVEGGEPIRDGIIWRVFGIEPAADGQLPLLSTAQGGSTTVELAPGEYLVHAAFGRAGATKRVIIGDDDQMESLVLNAGGLKLDGVVGDEQPIAADRLSFEVTREDESGEFVPVVPKATPGLVLRLAGGKYHVISRYGNVNAVVRADIEVEPGKLTEAVMRHTGALVTLKLVSAAGGEALANTSWTVINQDGTTVHESIGAFPSIVLAEGTYTAAASHADEIYSRDFTVESGMDRDVEVSLSDLVEPEFEKGGGPEISGAPMQP